MNLIDFITILENIPYLAEIIPGSISNEGDYPIYLQIKNALLITLNKLLSVNSEVFLDSGAFLDSGMFKYPSIVYDDNVTGYYILAISPNRIIIKELYQPHTIVNEEEAIILLKNRIRSEYPNYQEDSQVILRCFPYLLSQAN